MIKQYGLIQENIKLTDDVFGSVSRSVNDNIINESANWEDYLPDVEYQKIGFETMACITFSALNCLETLFKFQYKIDINFSDRFTAKMSGTTLYGNSFANVANSIHNDGLVEEYEYPYIYGYNEYYKDIPSILIDKGLSIFNSYEFNYEFVRNADIKEALKYAPLQVGVYAWTKPVNGIYPDFKNRNRNHGVMLYGYKEGEYWMIYDHYNNVKKKLAWDYNFGAILKYSIKLKEKSMLKLPNNTLVQEVEDSGQFGMYLNNKIYVGELSEILATVIMRSKSYKMSNYVSDSDDSDDVGDVGEQTLIDINRRAINKKDWDSVPKFNLKNEKIN